VPNSPMLVGPQVSFDYLNLATNHPFGGGSFLGNTINSITSVGITAGVNATPQTFVYASVGPSWIDRTQKLNFLGPTTAVDSSAPGATVGVGVQFRPSGWSVPLFFEVDETFVTKTSVSNPGSQGFLYLNSSDVTTVKGGVQWEFSQFGIGGTHGIW
jgi:hypothetical protein